MAEFIIKLSEEHANEFIRRTSWPASQKVWLIVLVILLCFFALIQAVGEDSFSVAQFLIVLLGGIAALGLFLLLRHYLRSRNIKGQLHGNPYFKYENKFTFENQTLSFSNEVSSLKILLDDISKVIETRNLFIIIINKANSLLLPKDQTPEELRNQLKSLTGKQHAVHRAT